MAKIHKILDTLHIAKRHNWHISSCPFCGEVNISAISEVLDYVMEKDCPCASRRRIYATCNYCGATSGNTTADVIGEDEIVAAAIERWNKRDNWRELVNFSFNEKFIGKLIRYHKNFDFTGWVFELDNCCVEIPFTKLKNFGMQYSKDYPKGYFEVITNATHTED